jgi:hypothetical protein
MQIITLAILVLLLIGLTDARMPVKGDHVQIIIPNGELTMVSDGIVTDISGNLLCISETMNYVLGGTPKIAELMISASAKAQ